MFLVTEALGTNLIKKKRKKIGEVTTQLSISTKKNLVHTSNVYMTIFIKGASYDFGQ